MRMNSPLQPVGRSVFPRRLQCLRVDVEALRRACPEPHGRQGQHARAASIVDDLARKGRMRVQPFEAQRGGRVRAGAEGEAGVKSNHARLGILDLLVMRADPQALAEAHGVKIAQPLALPRPIGQALHLELPRWQAERFAQAAHGVRRRGVGREQCLQARCRPQSELTRGRLEYRFVTGIGEGDGARTALEAGLLGRLRRQRAKIEADLQELAHDGCASGPVHQA